MDAVHIEHTHLGVTEFTGLSVNLGSQFGVTEVVPASDFRGAVAPVQQFLDVPSHNVLATDFWAEAFGTPVKCTNNVTQYVKWWLYILGHFQHAYAIETGARVAAAPGFGWINRGRAPLAAVPVPPPGALWAGPPLMMVDQVNGGHPIWLRTKSDVSDGNSHYLVPPVDTVRAMQILAHFLSVFFFSGTFFLTCLVHVGRRGRA